MKKHIIAVAVAAAFAAPVAMADTTLYGLANMSLDYIDAGNYKDANGKKTGGTNFNVASGSSRIGIKGSEAITKDLSAVYQAEFGVDMADGSTALTNRNQYAGLSSKSFGTFIAGRHDTPMKLAVAKYDLFGDQIGDNGNIMGAVYGASAGFNLRPGNVVAYMSPDLAGFSAILAYVADHDLVAQDYNVDYNVNDAYSLSATYAYKKLFNVTAAYENHSQKQPVITGAKSTSEDAWMIGAGVNVAGFTVNGLYQSIQNFADLDTAIWGLGAAYTFGKKHTIKGQYYNADYDGYADKRNMFAAGYDFAISKQTTLFAAYAYGDAGQATWGDGHGQKAVPTANADTNAFSVGMKYKF